MPRIAVPRASPAPARHGMGEVQVPFGAAPPSDDDAALARAIGELSARGAVTGARAQKLSVRVDPGVLAAASARLGMTHPSDVINASLALAAAPDRFKAWLRATPDRLSDDFRLPE
ncbi:MAG: hypothetical protein KGI51_13055 [Rhodospirillales bacterium]|nr:hypothetical protein [Rhodospirillales bacterium]